jgi:hypothetical protein
VKKWAEGTGHEEVEYCNTDVSSYEYPTFLKEEYFFALEKGIEPKEARESFHQQKEKEWTKITAPFSKRFLKNLRETDKNLMLIEEEIMGKLAGIYKRIENGIPLDGYCDYCPDKTLTIGDEGQIRKEQYQASKKLQKRENRTYVERAGGDIY